MGVTSHNVFIYFDIKFKKSRYNRLKKDKSKSDKIYIMRSKKYQKYHSILMMKIEI